MIHTSHETWPAASMMKLLYIYIKKKKVRFYTLINISGFLSCLGLLLETDIDTIHLMTTHAQDTGQLIVVYFFWFLTALPPTFSDTKVCFRFKTYHRVLQRQ